MKPLELDPIMLSEILSLGQLKSYPQGYLWEEKKPRTFPLLFIRKGAIRAYSKGDNGEITHYISIEGEFCCIDSFFSGVPTSMHMEVLEDSEVTEIYRDALHNLYKKQPAAQQFGRLLAEYQIFVVETNYKIISQKSAKERYRLFQQLYPHINGRFPLKHTASWLQIDQATLSRVRANKQRQVNLH